MLGRGFVSAQEQKREQSSSRALVDLGLQRLVARVGQGVR